MLSEQELIDLVLGSFEAEKSNNVEENQKLIHDNFSVTDMVLDKDGNPFPRLSGQKLQELIGEAFKIKGRQFIFNNVAADEKKQVVFVEFIESYLNPKTGKTYRTPQVAVCEIKDGKIFRTRHYMDPRLPHEYLDQNVIDEALE